MIVINVVFILSMVIGFGALAWGFAVQGYVLVARWILLFGGLWLIAKWRHWKLYSYVGFFFVVLFSAYGLWIGLHFVWMAIGAVGGLLAWDLSDFSERLSYAAPSDDVAGMQRRHLARVGIVAGLGGLLVLVVNFLHVRISFELAVGLVVLTVLGLTALVNALRRG